MNFYQTLVNQKIRHLTPADLKDLGATYGIHLSDQEATQVVHKLKTTPIDIFNESDRRRLINELATVTSPRVIAQCEALFFQFTGMKL